MKQFWKLDSGSYKIEPDSLFKFLEEKAFFIYKPGGDEDPILIRIKDNRIKHHSARSIRRYCSDYIRDIYEFQSPDEKIQVTNEFVKSKSLFSKENLLLLRTANIEEVRDKKDISYLFFKNCFFEITAERVEKKTYDHLEGQVWEKDIIDAEFIDDVPENIDPDGEYYEFLRDICKHDNKHAEGTNFDSLITIKGYLLHRYKDEAEAKAIILMDTYSDGHANGGTGKGIFRKGLEQIRPTVMQDGKLYRTGDKFAFSNLSYGTRIIAFDDVPKDFNFERLFPLITEKAVVERKYENKFVIPFEDSPKVLITTNYTIEGKGSSHRRRKIEFILSEIYHDEFTPEDKFGHLLFTEWDEAEWKKFYLFMAYCLQMYLLEGIVKPQFNVAERALKQQTPESFRIWAVLSQPGEKFNKKEELEDYISDFPEMKNLEQNTFTRWLKLYAAAHGWEMLETHSGNENYFEFIIIKK